MSQSKVVNILTEYPSGLTAKEIAIKGEMGIVSVYHNLRTLIKIKEVVVNGLWERKEGRKGGIYKLK